MKMNNKLNPVKHRQLQKNKKNHNLLKQPEVQNLNIQDNEQNEFNKFENSLKFIEYE